MPRRPSPDLPPLPVTDVLAAVLMALAEQKSAILVAPPGAGKTTLVPLALLDAAWIGERKIVLLEPRRLAARAAAERMAELLGERVGETVGIRSRLDTRISQRTRIEVVTEGVFTRMILDDPLLEGIGCVILDEFHERSLDADFALALLLDVRTGLRDDLRLLVMSATLDAGRVSRLLDGAPLVQSEGRMFPVDTRYLGRDTSERLDDAMTRAIAMAVRQETGSILAFLPGIGEIRRTAERLSTSLPGADIDVVQLHGGLDGPEQSAAIRPAAAGRRKVVLATAIAQTSITIEGVRVVVDCGFERVPRYEPAIGVTRLETVRVSRATADQRRGRAGRTEPGVCFRLWAEPQTQGLVAFQEPEIRSADLAGLLLDSAAWGVPDPRRLSWLDPPPDGPLQAASRLLLTLEAIDETGALTALGHRMRRLPLPARLARMVAIAPERERTHAAEIAAVISERGVGGRGTDLEARLVALRRDTSLRARTMQRQVRDWVRLAGEQKEGSGDRSSAIAASAVAASLLALAYPDRVAVQRGPRGSYLMANGRAGRLDAGDELAGSEQLVVAELQGEAASARILLAARLDMAALETIAADRIVDREDVEFDRANRSLRGRRVRRLGAIVLASEPRPVRPDGTTAEVLATGLASLGIDRLPWNEAQRQLRDRVGFLATRAAASGGAILPDLSDTHLAATAGIWLAPFLQDVVGIAEINSDTLGRALDAILPWEARRKLDAEAPTHYTAPTGNRFRIDYDADGGPKVSLRVQEMFGLKAHPSIASGTLPLTLELLSPAHRPIQITRDLPGFWAGSWADVRSDLRGRYPKHVWPEDPASAEPTARAKPRGK